MSNIKLYYIRGINSIDTPVFDDVLDQNTFFSGQSPQVIETSFYTPYYKNKINISTEDITFTSAYNYLSLDFNNKTYYYFIDSAVYINETVIELSITMDVIQTFMFDFELNFAELIRNSIPRWSGNKINRNYIRENISKADFVPSYVKIYNKGNDFSSHATLYDETSGTIVFKDIQDSWGQNTKGNRFTYGFDTPIEVFTAYYHMYLPVWKGKLRNASVTYRDSVLDPDQQPVIQDRTIEEAYSLTYITKNIATLRDIYYFPFIALQDIRTFSGYTVYSSNWYRIRDHQVANVGALAVNDGLAVNVNIFKDNHTFNFVKNTSTGRLFSSTYVPALLDENYMRVAFGEGGSKATYPLYQLDTLSLKCCYFPNVQDGTRNYYFEGAVYITFDTGAGYSYSYEDPFECAKQAESPARLDILTDQYAQYMTYNKGALIGALVKTAGGAFMGYAAGAARSSAINDYATSRYMTNYDNVKVRETIADYGDYQLSMNSINTGRDMTRGSDSLIGWAQGALNAAFMPDNPRQIGSVSADRLSNALTVSYSEYKVQDFDECARYFESNGYKVHEVVTGSITQFHYRTYYDVIQLSNVSLNFSGAIHDNFINTAIVNRLSSGLRLWHTEDSYLGRIDLVCERSSFHMGQLCIYDNVEVQ